MYWAVAILKAFMAFLSEKPFLLCGLIVCVVLGISFAFPFFDKVRSEHAKLLAEDKKTLAVFEMTDAAINPMNVEAEKKMNEPSIKTGDINLSGNTAPAQINIGSPGSQQIINQNRSINSQARIEKTQMNGNYIMRVILSQTRGFWDQGTVFQINAKMSGPYTKAEITQGLPLALFDVKIGEHKETGEYFYSMATAPLPDSPIVLEVISSNDINLEQLEVSPLAINP